MNNVKSAHPSLDRLTAFAHGHLGEAELIELSSHLSGCVECREKVEASGDDTLIALLRAADTEPDAAERTNRPEAVTLAPATQATTDPGLPAELAGHGRYRVQELLGVGGMGAVYKAEHLLMERPVALKLISQNLTSNPAMIERFRREVKTAGQLKHPHIVMAFDAEQAGASHFLVMEFVEGKSLARVVTEQGPLAVRQACDYIRQAALGLQHAHERGMVHRDIKPQNLMLTPDGQVKILDFGLARFAMETAPAGALLVAPVVDETPVASASKTAGEALTQIGTVMGTPDYIAPEQAQNAHAADIRADIYSLGCTLYDLLAGHAPFPDGTVVSKVMAHIERSPKPLSEVRKDVPLELVRVVERMMAKDPAQRYQTPAEVAAALASFASLTKPAEEKGRSRLRVLVAACAAAAALLLGGIIYVATDNGRLHIEGNVDDVELVVSKGGKEYELIDLKSGTRVKKLPTGDYQIAPKGARTDVKLSRGGFTITRWGETVVTVTQEPTLGAAKNAKIEAAAKPTEAWLKLVDAGDYAQAWEQCARSVRDVLSKGNFVLIYEQSFKSFGKPKSRTLGSRVYTRELPPSPDGEYVVSTYQSSFENWADIQQQVVAMLDNDGVWRVSQNVSFPQAIAPLGGDFALAIRAGRGQLSKEEQQELSKRNPLLAALLADPVQKPFVEVFAKLPDSVHKHLFKEGYLKWKFAGLDAARQKILRAAFQRGLEAAKKRGVAVPATADMEALEKSDVGAVLVNIFALKQSVVSWYILYPLHPQPNFLPVVGPAVEDQKAWLDAHLQQIAALRLKPYSKSIEELAKAEVGAAKSDKANLQGTWKGIAGMAMGERIKDEDARQVIVRFVGDTMDGPPSPGNKGGRGTFVLDPTKTPKQITVTGIEAGKIMVMEGIYSLDGDTLRICMSAPEHGAIKEFGGKVGLDITLRRKLEQTDQEKIQGTWKGVSAKVHGQQLPELVIKAIGPTITFAGNKVTWKASPTPEAKDLFGGMVTKFSLDGIFHLDPTKSPKTIDLTVLGAGAKTPLGTPAPRALLGIYKLEGDSLDVCMAIDPDHPEERPTKFATMPGKFIAHIVLKRQTPSGKEVIAANPRLRLTLENHSQIRALAFAPDGRSLVVGGDALTVFDPSNGKTLYEEKLAKFVTTPLSLARDGKAVAFGAQEWVYVFDLAKRKRITEIHASFQLSVALAPDGITLVYAPDRALRFHDLNNGTAEDRPETEGFFVGAKFSPDGRFLIATGDARKDLVLVLDARTRRVLDKKYIGGSGLTDISRDSKRLVVANSRQDKPVFQVFELSEGDLRLLYREANLPTGVGSLSLSPDGNHLALGLLNGTVQIWDLTRKKAVASWVPQQSAVFWYTPVAFSPDGKTLASGGRSTIKLWDLTAAARGEEVRPVQGSPGAR